MFFPDGEMPTAPLEAALARLGVACRRLSTGTAALSGFTLKAAALLLSSFEEVQRTTKASLLHLDSALRLQLLLLNICVVAMLSNPSPRMSSARGQCASDSP